MKKNHFSFSVTLFPIANSTLLTIGVIFNSSRSISPCSKNSELTRSATRFSIGHGLVIADKSHTVMLIARNNDRGSSLNQLAIEPGFTKPKNAPRFLHGKMEKCEITFVISVIVIAELCRANHIWAI